MLLKIAKLTKSAFSLAGIAIGDTRKAVGAPPESEAQLAQTQFPFAEASAREREIIDRTAPFTMTNRERQWALIKAVQYIDSHAIPGDIVECGVWRGGNIMLAKLARKDSEIPRRYFLFDTFRGMSPPSPADVDYHGRSASTDFEKSQHEDYNDNCYAPRDDVERNLELAGLTAEEVVLCEGRVEDTLLDPANIPEKIAILRLDTDWYESTRAELEKLWPKLSVGGVLIVDDYGCWQGARRAVDAFFGEKPPLFIAVDFTGRVAIKT
jgi:O-methyltransferase